MTYPVCCSCMYSVFNHVIFWAGVLVTDVLLPTLLASHLNQVGEILTKIKEVEPTETTDVTSNSVTTVQEVLGDMMGDAPACPDCGHITIRNGSCYKCLNCGNSLGCS